MTPQQRIQRAHVQLMRSKEFCLLSGVIMCGASAVKRGIPTAYTDGWNVYYGEEFVAKLDESEVNGVVAHENLHKMLRQLPMWQTLFKQDAKRANMAADYVVNLIIEDLDPHGRVARLPEGCLLDTKYRGMNTKQVFDLLDEQGSDGNGKGNGEGNGEPLDEHGWDEASGVSEQEQAERDLDLDRAVRQGQVLAGKMGGSSSRAIDELLRAKVDWREVLREFVTTATSGRDMSTWRRPNRRYLAQDMYMPSVISEAVGHIVVAIDTSGSVGGRELSAFVAEMSAICDTVTPDRVTLLWWDTQVRGVQEFDAGQYGGMVAALKPKGGGGTSFTCVTSYLRQMATQPECVVVLTDGCVSSWGDAPACPMMFAITSNVTAPYGVTVHVKGD